MSGTDLPGAVPAQPVRVVLWDADGVLQRVPRGAEESMRPAVEDRVDDVEAFLLEALAEERPALTGDVRWLDVLPGLLERWGIADAFDDMVRVWLSIEPVEESRQVVRELREAGVTCHLATNQAQERAAVMRDELGYADLVDGGFYSYELGAAKPDPAYFRAVLDALSADGVEAGEVFFVDDRADNVASARSLGIRAEVWCYRDGADTLRDHLARAGLPVACRPGT